MKLGIEKTATIWVRAGISYALTEAMDEGHCGLPTEDLLPLAEKLREVPQQLIRTALDLELQEGTVIADQVGETPCDSWPVCIGRNALLPLGSPGWQMARCRGPGSIRTKPCRGSRSASVWPWPQARSRRPVSTV